LPVIQEQSWQSRCTTWRQTVKVDL